MNSKNKKLLSKINDSKKHSSLEKIKRKKRRELYIILAVFLLLIGGAVFMFSPYVKLKNITVNGYNQTTKEEILEAGNINSTVKTWTVKDQEVENNIKDKYNIFKNVTVKSKMLSSITIDVEEYRIIAQRKLDDGSFLNILENGQAYTGQIRNKYNLPIVENFNDGNNKLSEVYKNLAQLRPEVLMQISEIINNDGEEITIYMQDGQKVKAVGTTFSEKLNYYDEISKYIKDKSKTTLNLVNGAYLETEKTDKTKNAKIKALLGSSTSNREEKKEDTNTTKKTTDTNKNS